MQYAAGGSEWRDGTNRSNGSSKSAAVRELSTIGIVVVWVHAGGSFQVGARDREVAACFVLKGVAY